MYGVVNALYWKNSKRQISIHLTVLKHQNTKTSLHKLSKNHWVFALFLILGSLRKKLQFTVFNDHPVPIGSTEHDVCFSIEILKEMNILLVNICDIFSTGKTE